MVPQALSKQAVGEYVPTEAWTDKQGGEQRSVQCVMADIVGASLRSVPTTPITKTTRSSVTDERRLTLSKHVA